MELVILCVQCSMTLHLLYLYFPICSLCNVDVWMTFRAACLVVITTIVAHGTVVVTPHTT